MHSEPGLASRGHARSRTTPRSLPGAQYTMATPSLRGRLARLGNPRRPVLKPNKPLILANRVGERRREKGGEQSEPGRPRNGNRSGRRPVSRRCRS
nr:coiled-coil-helix-coiled-coil-helix domain-containing protein 1 isoform X2 [Marmota flaviventris]